ncbi:hypothetical protein ACEQPO_13195 [Bacillus sp. SL00103]
MDVLSRGNGKNDARLDCIFVDMGAGLSKDQLGAFVLSAGEVVVVTTLNQHQSWMPTAPLEHLAIHQFEQSVQIIVNRCKTPSEGSENLSEISRRSHIISSQKTSICWCCPG